MLRIALKWGGMLGIAICVWTLCVHALGWYTTDLAKGQPADQVAIILPVISGGTDRSQLLGALVGTLTISIWNLRRRLGDHAILWEPSGQGDPNVASLRKHRGLICGEVSGSHRSSFSVQEQAELEPDTHYREIKC